MVSTASVLKLSANLRIIQEGEKALLYNAFYGGCLFCHKDMLDVIEGLRFGITMCQLMNRYPNNNLKETIQNLIKKGLVVESRQHESNQPYRTYPPEIINSGGIINKLRLNVSMTCNMQCVYCYVDTDDNRSMDRIMNWSTARKAMDIFFDLQEKHNHEQCTIRFFGGEPLLNWKLISKCLDYIGKIKNDITIDYILNTNGTVFSASMAEKLAEHRVGLAVSIDGIHHVHDRFRKFKGGGGTARKVMGNLEKFIARGCNVGVETTVGDHNIFELEKLVLLIANLQVNYETTIPMSLQNISVVDRENLDTTEINTKVEQLIKLLVFADRHGVRADTGLVHFPFNALKRQREYGAYCRAIGNELCIYPDGGVYPCGALPIRLGTIENIEAVFITDAYHQLVSRVAGNIQSCKGCEIEAFCAGGCTADGFTADKVLHAPAKNCALERKLFHGLVKCFLLSQANLEKITSYNQRV